MPPLTTTPRPIPNSHWIEPGKLLAGEYPTTQDTVQKLLKAGVTAFIDLTEEGELSSYHQWIGNAMYEKYPIQNESIPKPLDLTVKILDSIDQHIINGRLVYLHCWGGRGRTGVIAGCWLARHGNPGTAALETLGRLWRQNPRSILGESPENEQQRRYVLLWRG